MFEVRSVEPGLQTHIERADQTIIEGEKRIGRLIVLLDAAATRGYNTDGINTLMSKHLALLASWRTRRASMIERMQSDRSDAEIR